MIFVYVGVGILYAFSFVIGALLFALSGKFLTPGEYVAAYAGGLAISIGIIALFREPRR